VAFFDPISGQVYCHHRVRGGLDLPGGHRDSGEGSAAEALLRECLLEELRVPDTLAARLRKYAKLEPHVQVVPRRKEVHVVSLWLVPATPEELAGIEQTDDGKSEAHSPAMRPFAELQAGTLYADALAAGLHDLNHRKLARRFGSSSIAAPTSSNATSSATAPVVPTVPPAAIGVPPGVGTPISTPAPAIPLPAGSPTSIEPPTPDAAKLERGIWFYRLTYPSRRGSVVRWFPSSRFSADELSEFEPLRSRWNDDHGTPPPF
jgi:8-oxo-dGTP pyrophosphatase MutT (NUDIX family)